MTFDRIALIAVVVLAAGFGLVEQRAGAQPAASDPMRFVTAASAVPAGGGSFLVGAFLVNESGEVRLCQGILTDKLLPGKPRPEPHFTCVPENQ